MGLRGLFGSGDHFVKIRNGGAIDFNNVHPHFLRDKLDHPGFAGRGRATKEARGVGLGSVGRPIEDGGQFCRLSERDEIGETPKVTVEEIGDGNGEGIKDGWLFEARQEAITR
jgi:hypothetical protein